MLDSQLPWGFISPIWFGSVKTLTTLIEVTSRPQLLTLLIKLETYANVGGLFIYMAFSTILLAPSGILKASKAYRKIPGLLFEISHIMSRVLSSPAIVVLMSRFGRFVSCVFTVCVIRDTNCRWRYSSCLRMNVEVGFTLLLRWSFFDILVWGGSSKNWTPSRELTMQM